MAKTRNLRMFNLKQHTASVQSDSLSYVHCRSSGFSIKFMENICTFYLHKYLIVMSGILCLNSRHSASLCQSIYSSSSSSVSSSSPSAARSLLITFFFSSSAFFRIKSLFLKTSVCRLSVLL